jgi:hypothetical protein
LLFPNIKYFSNTPHMNWPIHPYFQFSATKLQEYNPIRVVAGQETTYLNGCCRPLWKRRRSFLTGTSKHIASSERFGLFNRCLILSDVLLVEVNNAQGSRPHCLQGASIRRCIATNISSITSKPHGITPHRSKLLRQRCNQAAAARKVRGHCGWKNR